MFSACMLVERGLVRLRSLLPSEKACSWFHSKRWELSHTFFTHTPLFSDLKQVIWWTVDEQVSFISVFKRMRKKKKSNSLLVKSKNS